MLTTYSISSFARTALPALLVCMFLLGIGEIAKSQTLTLATASPCFSIDIDFADPDACGDETTPCGDPANPCGTCYTITITNLSQVPPFCTNPYYLRSITFTRIEGDDCSIICGCDVDIEREESGEPQEVITTCTDEVARRVSYRAGFGNALGPGQSFSFTICFSSPTFGDEYTIDFHGEPNPLTGCDGTTPCGQAVLEMQ